MFINYLMEAVLHSEVPTRLMACLQHCLGTVSAAETRAKPQVTLTLHPALLQNHEGLTNQWLTNQLIAGIKAEGVWYRT